MTLDATANEGKGHNFGWLCLASDKDFDLGSCGAGRPFHDAQSHPFFESGAEGSAGHLTDLAPFVMDRIACSGHVPPLHLKSNKAGGRFLFGRPKARRSDWRRVRFGLGHPSQG